MKKIRSWACGLLGAECMLAISIYIRTTYVWSYVIQYLHVELCSRLWFIALLLIK